MTYTGETPILSAGSVSAEAIQAYFADRGPDYAPQYAPDGQYKPAPAGLGAAIVAECRRYPEHIVNHDLVAAQIVIETAAWQSGYARERNNTGGIGAINSNPDQAVWFASVAAGVRAHVAHLLVYAVGDGEWTRFDPRRDAVAAQHWLGVAKTWAELNGRWAWPGTTYGQGIATLANRLTTFANDGRWNVAGDDPRFNWVPDTKEFGYPTAGTRGRSGRPIDLLIVHVTEGTDSLGWLNGGNGSSAHYLTNRDATPRAQMVREADAAWTAGSREYNERGISIEFERFAREAWTGTEYRNAAATVYPILKRNNIPLAYLGRNNATGRGIIGHEHVPDPDGSGWGGAGNHTDPGPQFDWSRFMAELRALDGPVTPPVSPDSVTFPETGQTLSGGFLRFWEARGGLRIFGFPIGPEHVENGVTVQMFERARFEWVPGSDPGNWDVQLGLLGVEVQALQERLDELEAA